MAYVSVQPKPSVRPRPYSPPGRNGNAPAVPGGRPANLPRAPRPTGPMAPRAPASNYGLPAKPGLPGPRGFPRAAAGAVIPLLLASVAACYMAETARVGTSAGQNRQMLPSGEFYFRVHGQAQDGAFGPPAADDTPSAIFVSARDFDCFFPFFTWRGVYTNPYTEGPAAFPKLFVIPPPAYLNPEFWGGYASPLPRPMPETNPGYYTQPGVREDPAYYPSPSPKYDPFGNPKPIHKAVPRPRPNPRPQPVPVVSIVFGLPNGRTQVRLKPKPVRRAGKRDGKHILVQLALFAVDAVTEAADLINAMYDAAGGQPGRNVSFMDKALFVSENLANIDPVQLAKNLAYNEMIDNAFGRGTNAAARGLGRYGGSGRNPLPSRIPTF